LEHFHLAVILSNRVTILPHSAAGVKNYFTA
jgi:hypothetical protein